MELLNVLPSSTQFLLVSVGALTALTRSKDGHFSILFNLIGWSSQNTIYGLETLWKYTVSLWRLQLLSTVRKNKNKNVDAPYKFGRDTVSFQRTHYDRCASGVDGHCDPTSYQNTERPRLLRSHSVLLQCNCNTIQCSLNGVLTSYWMWQRY